MNKRIAILGGGIAGLTAAIALQNIGIAAMVFEAAAEIKEAGAGIGLGANAIKAFQQLGIETEVSNAGRYLPSFTIYNQWGKAITKTDSVSLGKKYGLDNFTIHRAALQQLLLGRIDNANVFTNKRVKKIQREPFGTTIYFEDGTTYETDFIIAAEGIHSATRKQLLPGSKIRYAGYTCWRAVIDNASLQLNECSETWGSNGRFGIVPLAHNKIYWFACINAPANNSTMKQYTIKELLHQFRDYHQDIIAVLGETKNEHLIWSDIIDLQPIHQYAFDNIVLVGDAAHATTPNLGQGACQAIEDAVVLADEIKKNNDLTIAFKQFEKRRMKRTHWITATSHQIGTMAQLENKLLIRIRDFIFLHTPQHIKDRQFKKLYTTDF